LVQWFGKIIVGWHIVVPADFSGAGPRLMRLSWAILILGWGFLFALMLLPECGAPIEFHRGPLNSSEFAPSL
jgi:hypothetical protein